MTRLPCFLISCNSPTVVSDRVILKGLLRESFDDLNIGVILHGVHGTFLKNVSLSTMPLGKDPKYFR